MTLAQTIEYISTAMLVFSAAYLVWRTLAQVSKQRRSYQNLPFGGAPRAYAGDPQTERAQAALLGVALGDALGMPRESLPRWLANLRYGREPKLSRGLVRFMRRRGTVSDDTQLTVATARSIDDDGSYDSGQFRRRLADWTTRAIGPGRATLRATKGWRRGQDQRDFDSQGNGAAMRVIPLAIAFRHDRERMIEVVRENAETTHPNPEAVAGAEAVARVGAWLLEVERDSVLEVASLVEVGLPRTTTCEFDDWKQRLERAVDADNLGTIGTTGWVKHSVPALVYLLAAYGADVESALGELWECGGDVDTIAALYMGCVGAWRGLDAFDAAMLEEVQGAGVLFDEGARLRRLAHH